MEGLYIGITRFRDDIEIFMSPSKILFSADRTTYKAAFNVCDGLPVNEMAEMMRGVEND